MAFPPVSLLMIRLTLILPLILKFKTSHHRAHEFKSTASVSSTRPIEYAQVWELFGNGEGSANSGRGRESKSQERQKCVGIWATMEITAQSGKVVKALGPIMAEAAS